MNIKSQKRYRLCLIVLLYLVWVTIGIRVGAYGDESAARTVLNTLLLALILTHICIVDRRIVGKPLLTSFYWLVFILSGIAVPVCVIRARGLRGAVIVAIHFVGILLVYLAAAIVTSLLVNGTMFPF